ncbi:putative RING finger protein [Yarrowia sp. B02]|nr:putative RING finger protein [Yarrowia sp. B02]
MKRYILDPSGDYRAITDDPEAVPTTKQVLLMRLHPSQKSPCPICLHPEPVGPYMLECGHVFCISCLYRLVQHDEGRSEFKIASQNDVTCPSCVYKDFDVSRGKFVLWDEQMPGETSKDHLEMQMKVRVSGNCSVVRDCNCENASNSSTIPYHTQKGFQSSRYLLGDREALVAYFSALKRAIEAESILDHNDETFSGDHVSQVVQLVEDKIRESEALEVETGKDTTGETTEEPQGDVFAHTPKGDFYVSPKKRSALKAQFPTVSHIPSHMKRPVRLRHYYQGTAGEDVYLSKLDSKILQTAFGSMDKSPGHINVPVEAVTQAKVTREMKRDAEYEHLPADLTISLVEIDWEKTDLVPPEVLVDFTDAISRRREARERVKRAERAAQKKMQRNRRYDEDYYYDDDDYDDGGGDEYETNGGLPPLDLFDCVTKVVDKRW